MSLSRRSFLSAFGSAIAACGLKPSAAVAALPVSEWEKRIWQAMHFVIRGRTLEGQTLEQHVLIDPAVAALAHDPETYLRLELDTAVEGIQRHPDFDNAEGVTIIDYGVHPVFEEDEREQ